MIAWGDCTQHLQAWAQTLHPTLKLDSEHAACKVNSADASLVLATLPMKVDVDEDGQGKFGVRISHCGSSRVNPYNNQALSLYVKEASQLR